MELVINYEQFHRKTANLVHLCSENDRKPPMEQSYPVLHVSARGCVFAKIPPTKKRLHVHGCMEPPP